MDKQKISRQLHRLAQEEVPDTMNLWPKMQAQLKRKSKPRSFSLAHALSVFVMTMLVAVGGYVAYQTNNVSDPVAPSYGVEPNLIQTDGAVTASIDWAYADENIIAIQYSLIYNPEFFSQALYVDSRLNSYGYWFPSYAMGLEPEPLEDGNVRYTGYTYYSMVYFPELEELESLDVRFDMMLIEGWDESSTQMGVLATVPPPDFTATPIPFNNNMAAPISLDSNATVTPTPVGQSIATGTPFGEFEPTVPPPDTFSIEPSLIPPVDFNTESMIAYGTLPAASFGFTFNLPVHESRTGQAAEAELESNGSAISIQNLLVTPIMTSFELCYQYPDLLGTWYPSVAVDTGFAPPDAQRYSPIIETMRAQFGKVYMAGIDEAFTSAEPWSSYDWEFNLDPITHINCAPMRSFAPFSEDSTALDIRVDYLYRETDPLDLTVWNNDIDFFAARGFTLRYELLRPNDEVTGANILLRPVGDIGEVMVTLHDYPDSMTLAEATEYVSANMLKERLEGDWSFHITLDN